jgi:hypothetical protein
MVECESSGRAGLLPPIAIRRDLRVCVNNLSEMSVGVKAQDSHETYRVVGVDPLGRNEHFLFLHPWRSRVTGVVRTFEVE